MGPSRKLTKEFLVLARSAFEEAALNLDTFKKMPVSSELQNSHTVTKKVEWLEEEYYYFYYLIYKKKFPDIFPPQDEDIATIGAKVDILDFAVGLHDALDTVRSAVIQNKATPFVPFAKFLTRLGIFSRYLPPLWLAINGALGFWDIYLTLTTPQTKLAKAVKLMTTIVGVGLSIAALACPPIALIFGAIAMLFGLFRESFSYLDAQFDLENERLQLVEYQCRLAILDDEESRCKEAKQDQCVTNKRRAFLGLAIKKQKERIEELRLPCRDRRLGLFFCYVSMIGVLLLAPPSTVIGVSILLSLIAINLERRLGMLKSIFHFCGYCIKKLRNRCYQPAREAPRIDLGLMAIPKFDKDAKCIFKYMSSPATSVHRQPSTLECLSSGEEKVKIASLEEENKALSSLPSIELLESRGSSLSMTI